MRKPEQVEHQVADLQRHALAILSGHAGELSPPVLRATLLLILAITDWPAELGTPTTENLRQIVEPTSVFLAERTSIVCGEKDAEPTKES